MRKGFDRKKKHALILILVANMNSSSVLQRENQEMDPLVVVIHSFSRLVLIPAGIRMNEYLESQVKQPGAEAVTQKASRYKSAVIGRLGS